MTKRIRATDTTMRMRGGNNKHRTIIHSGALRLGFETLIRALSRLFNPFTLACGVPWALCHGSQWKGHSSWPPPEHSQAPCRQQTPFGNAGWQGRKLASRTNDAEPSRASCPLCRVHDAGTESCKLHCFASGPPRIKRASSLSKSLDCSGCSAERQVGAAIAGEESHDST